MNPEAELTRLYHADYARLVRTLGVAFDPRDAADAVQEAYLARSSVGGWSLHMTTRSAGSGASP